MGESGFGRLKERMRGRFSDESPDDTYLSYYDIRLTNEDVETLKYDWLTDNIIAFWEEYLEREFLTRYSTSNIILLRPSMTFMLLQTADPRTLRDALPSFTKTTHIFLPINDCRNVNEAEGGTHWSLLLVSAVDGIAFHYDSLPPGNTHEALNVTQKLGLLLNKRLHYVHLDDSPVQENSSDCGVFVCLSMRHLLLKRLLMANSTEKISMSLGGMKVDANGGRKEMVRIIDRFRKKAERRRSYVFFYYSFLVLLVVPVCCAVLLSLFFPAIDVSSLPEFPVSFSSLSLPSSLSSFDYSTTLSSLQDSLTHILSSSSPSLSLSSLHESIHTHILAHFSPALDKARQIAKARLDHLAEYSRGWN